MHLATIIPLSHYYQHLSHCCPSEQAGNISFFFGGDPRVSQPKYQSLGSCCQDTGFFGGGEEGYCDEWPATVSDLEQKFGDFRAYTIACVSRLKYNILPTTNQQCLREFEGKAKDL